MPYRSARIEALLGGRVEQASYEAVAGLVGNVNAAESDDLDYKIKYDPKTTAREELAKDIAAFANATGGVIIVGVADDKKTALPTRAVETSIEDRILRWIRETASTNIAPLPNFDIVPVPSHNNPASGFIIIAVPRSAAAPHAVFDPASRRALAYPRRHGRTTTWLPETMVATAYRERFSGARAREDRLNKVESDLLDAFWEGDQWEPLLVVSMVPELPGEMDIDAAALEDFRLTAQREKLFGNGRANLDVGTVGANRLQVRSANEPVELHAEVYSDGSGAWGQVPWNTRTNSESAAAHVDDVTLGLLNACYFLGKNAQLRAGVNGTTLLRASLFSSYIEHKDFAGHRPLPLMGQEVGGPVFDYISIGDFVSSRSVRELGSRRLGSATGEAVGFVESLADGGTGLASTVSVLASKVFQAFGLVECPELTKSGRIRKHEWHTQHFNWLERWASTSDVEFVS